MKVLQKLAETKKSTVTGIALAYVMAKVSIRKSEGGGGR